MEGKRWLPAHFYHDLWDLFSSTIIVSDKILIVVGHSWRIAAGLCCCSVCQAFCCSLFILEEISIKKSDGVFLFMQLCHIPYRSSQVCWIGMLQYSWKTKAECQNNYLLQLLQSREGDLAMYWCCCSWTWHTWCGMLIFLIKIHEYFLPVMWFSNSVASDCECFRQLKLASIQSLFWKIKN